MVLFGHSVASVAFVRFGTASHGGTGGVAIVASVLLPDIGLLLARNPPLTCLLSACFPPPSRLLPPF